jgi:ABC-type glutathione transport system ATPase component
MGVNWTAETPVSLNRNISMNLRQGDTFAKVGMSGSETKMARSGKVVGAHEVKGNLTGEMPVSLHCHNSMNSIQGDQFSGVGLSGLTMQKKRQG